MSQAVVEDLRQKGLTVRMSAEQKILVSPADMITPEIAKMIRDHRESILDFLWAEQPFEGELPDFNGAPITVLSDGTEIRSDIMVAINVFGEIKRMPLSSLERLIEYNRQTNGNGASSLPKKNRQKKNFLPVVQESESR
jgi:hypothetical protein